MESELKNDEPRWYTEVTRYQWLVLLIASLGWVFDVFEGQIFVASMKEAMPSLMDQEALKLELIAKKIVEVDIAGKLTAQGEVQFENAIKGYITYYNNIAFGLFLVGGAIGGILFGMLSDRIGRKKTMSYTIIFYSLFTCVSAFSQDWWHMAGLRFFVAMGVGGEWAIASAMVAEVFPKKARAHVGSIFHASSVFGTYLAIAAGVFLIGNPALHEWATTSCPEWLSNIVDPVSLPWRMGFALGVLPALLIIWIRISVKEPESWKEAQERARQDPSQKVGSIADLFSAQWIRSTFVGVSLAAVGLATFWGAHIYGKDVFLKAMKNSYLEEEVASDDSLASVKSLTKQQKDAVFKKHEHVLKRWEMFGMFIVTTGGGIGLVLFGTISERLGRRGTFLLFHLAGLASALLVFQVLEGVTVLLIALPIFGFLTLGMHAGYAIYFPELFPTRLRGTGAGFCFNGGRILAAPILFISGWMQKDWGYSLENAATILSLLYLIGVLVLVFAPETKGQELPE